MKTADEYQARGEQLIAATRQALDAERAEGTLEALEHLVRVTTEALEFFAELAEHTTGNARADMEALCADVAALLVTSTTKLIARARAEQQAAQATGALVTIH